MTPFQTYLRRVASHWSLYLLGPVAGLFTSFLSLIVLTRLLPLREYAQLALLVVFSSLLTLVYNLGTYQGTNRVGFSTSDRDNLFPELDREESRRVAMGCGITTTGAVGLLGTVVAVSLARPIAQLLLHDRSLAFAVAVAAVEGAAAGVLRVSGNVLRLERRPFAWTVIQAAKPAVSLIGAVALIELGYGVTGAIAGWLIGSIVTLTGAFVAAHRSFRFAFHLKAVGPIYAAGAAMIPAAIGFWIMSQGDLLVASRVVPLTSVGRYRVDARIGGFVYPFMHAFIYSWGTLLRDPVYLAATNERTESKVNREMLTYFAAVGFGAVLLLAVFDHQILFIVPARFRIVSLLVPILGLRWAVRGFLQAFYRILEYPGKRRDFGLVAFGASLVAVGAAIPLGQRFGLYGIAGAISSGPAIALAGLAAIAVHHRRLPNLEYLRATLAALIALGCATGDQLLTRGSFLFGLVWLVGYPLALVGAGVLPVHRLRVLFAAFRAHRVPSSELLRRVEKLPADARDVLVRCVTDRPKGHSLALPEPDELSIFVRALRTVGSGTSDSEAADAAVGKYVLWAGAPAQRDAFAHELWSMGVDPAEVDSLVMTYKRLRRKHRWLKNHAGGPPTALAAPEAT